MCAPIAAANGLSVASTISNGTVLQYIETRHRHRQSTRIHPGSRSTLELLLAAELGATDVVRAILGGREVVIATTPSKDVGRCQVA
jgi:hypothetical protein